MNNNTTNEEAPLETGDNLVLLGGPTSAFKPPVFRAIQPFSSTKAAPNNYRISDDNDMDEELADYRFLSESDQPTEKQMSSNYLVNEEEQVDFTMLNVVNQFDQRSKRNSDGRKLDSTNMFRNMMMFRRERSYLGEQSSIPLSANVGVYEYLTYYDSIKLTEISNYADAIAEPPAQNPPSYGQSDVSMNLINNEENYYETNHNQNNIKETNSNYQIHQIDASQAQQQYEEHPDSNENNNFISDINQSNDYHRFDYEHSPLDDQQQFDTQNVEGIDYFENDDENYNSDSSVEWLDDEDENDLNADIEVVDFEEHLANRQKGDELDGTHNEDTRELEIEQANSSLEVPSNSRHNLKIQMDNSVYPDNSTINLMQPFNDEPIVMRQQQELPSGSLLQSTNDQLIGKHDNDSNLSNGDETGVDERWKENENGLAGQESLVSIDNAENDTTIGQESSEDISLNGSIPSTSVHQRRRSSPRITTKSRTDQEMNNPGLIGYRKNKEDADQKRNQPLHLNKTKQNVRKADEDDANELSDDNEIEDEEDGQDDRTISHGGNQFKTIGIFCPECSQLMDNKHKLNEHLLNVHKKSPFICGAFGCKQRFNKYILFKRHYQLHDNKTKWTCSVANCKYSTLHRGYLLRHLHRLHAKGRYQCCQCSKEYSFHQEAANHFDNHHKTKTFQCTFGGCSFKSPFESKLKDHQMFHINLKPYNCTWKGCGHASNIRRRVINHIRTKHFKQSKLKLKCDLDPNQFLRTKSFNFKRELQKAQRNYNSNKKGDDHSISSTVILQERELSSGSLLLSIDNQLNDSDGDETLIDESWKENENDSSAQESFFVIYNAMNVTTKLQEQSKDSIAISPVSIQELRRQSSRRITSGPCFDQPMNKFGVMVDNRKNAKMTVLKRKRPLHSNKAKKKVRMDNEEDSELSDEIEDDGDGVDHLKIKTIGVYCPECSQLIDNKFNLNEHLLRVHRKSPFICGAFECKQRFDKSEMMMEHCKLHDKETKWTCTATNCEYITTNQNYLRKHLSWSHVKGRFQCGICSKEYPFRKKAHSHFDHKHKTRTFQCGRCSFKTLYESKLKEHQLRHTNLKPFECTWKGCGYSSNRRRDVIKHVRVVHFMLPSTLKAMKQRKIECDRDPNEFVREKSLDASMKRVPQRAQRNDNSKNGDGCLIPSTSGVKKR